MKRKTSELAEGEWVKQQGYRVARGRVGEAAELAEAGWVKQWRGRTDNAGWVKQQRGKVSRGRGGEEAERQSWQRQGG